MALRRREPDEERETMSELHLLQRLSHRQRNNCEHGMCASIERCVQCAIAEAEDLERRLRAAEKDAERYRWLRNRFDGDGQDIGVLVECRHRAPNHYEVDAAIDAAIRREAE